MGYSSRMSKYFKFSITWTTTATTTITNYDEFKDTITNYDEFKDTRAWLNQYEVWEEDIKILEEIFNRNNSSLAFMFDMSRDEIKKKLRKNGCKGATIAKFQNAIT